MILSQQILAKGMNTIRVNFLAERLIPDKQTGPMDQAYFKDLKEVCYFFYDMSRFFILQFDADRWLHHQERSICHDSST
jgi:hypothetical protein